MILSYRQLFARTRKARFSFRRQQASGSSWTRNVQTKHPLACDIVIYGLMSGGAELTQQLIHLHLSDGAISTRTIAEYTGLGGLVIAPLLHMWYKYLDRKLPGSSIRLVVFKVIVDCLVIGIPFYSIFYIGTAMIERSIGDDGASSIEPSENDLLGEWRTKIVPTYVAGLIFWLPAQFINFRWLGTSNRVLFVAVCTYIDVNILCAIKRYWPLK